MLQYLQLSIIFTFFLFPLSSSLSFNMSSISSSDISSFNITGDAFISDYDGGLELTQYNENNPDGTAGRATYATPLHLWDEASRSMADFSTHFSCGINSDYNLSGYGMAFFLAPIGSSIKAWSSGGGLGLGMGGTPVSPSSMESFVAVEFDTSVDPEFDPPYSPHLGIDINSMRSVTTAKWKNDFGLYGRPDEVWITYNASSKMMTIDFMSISSSEPHTQRGSLSYEVDLRDHLPEYVTVGFSATTNASLYEKYFVESWDFSSTLQLSNNAKDPTMTKKNRRVSYFMIIVYFAAGLLVVLLISLWLLRKNKILLRALNTCMPFLGGDSSMDEEFIKGSGPRMFTYRELARATGNFKEKLGEGGFGKVYKGRLRDTMEYVAVKRVSKESQQGQREYESEVKIISQVRHINLVKLKGWCHQRRELLLVYEFMPNGSLDSHLFREDPPFISWEMRYKIAQGVASALFYLHEYLEKYVVHRDIKSSNIMLDSDFNSKIGDFGLARFVDRDKDLETTTAMGTHGYVAPELYNGGRASKASDIYSFGVVLLEIACGRRVVDPRYPQNQVSLGDWVRQLDRAGHLLDAADPKLDLSKSDARKVHQLLVVGMRCAHPDSSQRPLIGEVVKDLYSELSCTDRHTSLGDESTGEV